MMNIQDVQHHTILTMAVSLGDLLRTIAEALRDRCFVPSRGRVGYEDPSRA